MTGINYYRLFVRDLELETVVGVHRHEKKRAQKLRVTISILAHDTCANADDQLERVICYESVTERVRTFILAQEDKGLLETLASQLMTFLFEDERILGVRLRLEKPQVRKDAQSIGIELCRMRQGEASSWAEFGD